MKLTKPTSDQWERLFELSEKIWQLAPWEKISESDVLGVKFPGDGPTVFVCIMGSLGQHRAVVVYIGVRALFELIELQELGVQFSPFEILETPHCSVSFEPRREMETADLAALRRTRRKFDRDGHPVFRKIVPGFLPELIDSDHAAILTTALEQFLEVYPRAADGYLGKGDGFLVREPTETASGIGWTDNWRELRYPDPEHFKAEIPDELKQSILRLPQKRRTVLQMDAFPLPMTAEKNGFEFLPRTLVACNKAGTEVVGTEVFDRARTQKANFDLLVGNFFGLLLQIGFRPGKIVYFSEEFQNLAAELSDELGIRFEEGRDYGAFDDLRQTLAQAADDPELFEMGLV